LCPRYSARIVDAIKIGPSAAWLRFRLEACAVRAINNVVDITNYVMLETGQPLHAFDLDLLPGRRIVVRPAGKAMKFTTLDGAQRELVAEDLLICAGDDPVALAGVMGGMDSEVRESTKSILLESANFDGTAIRRTAKRLGLHSEASHRFERGVDADGTLAALDRAAAMLAELAGATPVPGVVDCYPRRSKPFAIALREERIAKLLGVAIDGKRAEKLLQSLGVKTERRAGKIIKCLPPSSRSDLTREVDLIEELARLHGYDKVPSTLPRLRPSDGAKDERLSRERKVRAFLAGEGLVEVINLPYERKTQPDLHGALGWRRRAAGGGESVGAGKRRVASEPGPRTDRKPTGESGAKERQLLRLPPRQSFSDGARRRAGGTALFVRHTLRAAGAARAARRGRASFGISRLQGAGGRRVGFVAHR